MTAAASRSATRASRACELRRKLAASLVVLAVTPVRGDGGGPKSRNLRTELRASHEVPIVVSGAKGSFRARFADDGQSFTYVLDYSDLEGTVTQSHIHIAQPFASGGMICDQSV